MLLRPSWAAIQKFNLHSSFCDLHFKNTEASPLYSQCVCVVFVFLHQCRIRSSDGSVESTKVFPGAHPRLPAAHSSAGPGAGVAAAGYLPAVSAPLDVR